MNSQRGVGIIGAGRMGRIRAASIRSTGCGRLIAVADARPQAADGLSAQYEARVCHDYRKLLDLPEIEMVIVATTHDALCALTQAALAAGKHVLCEKPLGRDVAESRSMVTSARTAGRLLKTGFNHRYHPGIAAVQRLTADGWFGKLCFLRCRYGHGGRPGYEREWRMQRERSGGGELLDQGIHVLDLFRWLAGDFQEVFGSVASHVWSAEIEDNAFALLRTAGDCVASMHVSWTQWRNLFSMEICGRDGYGVVEGLGGSYGPEVLRWGKRSADGAPVEQEETFDTNTSWDEEWRAFYRQVEQGPPFPVGENGLAANVLAAAVYSSARTGTAVRL